MKLKLKSIIVFACAVTLLTAAMAPQVMAGIELTGVPNKPIVEKSYDSRWVYGIELTGVPGQP